jgi:hypothetical protein
MAAMPTATISAPTTPTAIRYGWLNDARAAIRRRQRVSAIRSRRLRVSSASYRASRSSRVSRFGRLPGASTVS